MTSRPQGWAFVVARGRHTVFRTILAPGFLVQGDLHGLLTEAAGGGAGRAELDNAVVGPLSIGYVREPLTLADVDEGEPGSEPLTDEHGRQIVIAFGIVCRQLLGEPIDGDDLRAARAQALQTYRRFLDDETGFRVEVAAALALRTAVLPWPSDAAPAGATGQADVAPGTAGQSGSATGQADTAAGQAAVAAPTAPPAPPWAMRSPRRRTATLGALAALAAASGATFIAVGGDEPVAPLTARVPDAPRIVLATDGRRHIAYEIELTNDTAARVRVERIEALDATGGRPLATYSGSQVARLAGGAKASALTLARASRRTLAIDLRMRAGERPPARIGHRFMLAVASADGGARRVAFTAPATSVDRRAPSRVELPLTGKNLLVTATLATPVRQLAQTSGSTDVIRRFAIDFQRLRDDATTALDGDPNVNTSYLVYGDRVVAVAAGTVVAVRDDVPDNTPPGGRPRSARGDARGNFVVQDVGGGHFALYAGLRRASVRVRPGQRLRRGQRLAAVGNSGDSDQPRLRFRLTDRAGAFDPAGGGLALVFDRFRLLARLTRDPGGVVRRRPASARAHSGEMPLAGDVIGGPA